MQTNFQDKNAIITGGSSGIGKATARLLARHGANVFIVARREKMLNAALDEIGAERNNARQVFRGFPADVSKGERMRAVVNTIVESGHHPDILVNSAGIASCNYFDELTLDDFRRTMDTNFFGTVKATQAVLPFMKDRHSGHIVNVSSVAGIVGIFGYTAYGATKFAVRGFSDALRMELKPYNVHVSVLFPPDTDTPQLQEENKTKPLETKRLSGTVKLASPEQVAMELLRGIQKKKRMIICGTDTKMLYALYSILPSALERYLDHVVAKAHQERLRLENASPASGE
ncbi:MAG: SDR family oxidoreductase [Chloroflexota bacterium]|nr:SDR family oxidoreductase [Chloroflexota bacterium]